MPLKKTLFLHPYPKGTAASQRFRFEHYYTFLEENGFEIVSEAFLDMNTWKILYQEGNTLKKVKGIIKGFFRRLKVLYSLSRVEYVFVHREATPIFFPLIEWWIAKVAGKKLIFDFDDAIWLPNTSSENKIISWVKFPQKTHLICRWATKISAGNQYLANFALQYNKQVFIQPTVVNTTDWHNVIKNQQETPLTIGWTGTHSTLKYLEILLPILEKLENQFKFIFLVIADKNPNFNLKSFEFCEWQKTTEIQDLLKMNIGVMPLHDDIWTRGKCGFKAIQYMALGIPTLASPVEVNTQIIDHAKNGFLCHTEQDWEKYLTLLLLDEKIRTQMGREARQKIVGHYAVASQKDNFLQLFQEK